jgi:hypothetical protein
MATQNKFKKIIKIIITIILLGILIGFLYSLLPTHNPQRNKYSCESIGGEWLNQNNTCLISYKEAGENCTDGSQCKSGICFPPDLTQQQIDSLKEKPLDNIIGTCYPDMNATGCIKQVINGRISEKSMCIKI